MYVSYTSIPTSVSTNNAAHTNYNHVKNSHFGVVLKSLNHSNTNSLSSTYLDQKQSQNPTLPCHYQLADHRQLGNSLKNNSLSKSASTQIIRRQPSFTANRSDIRYTEIIAATDDFLRQLSSERLDQLDVENSALFLATSNTALNDSPSGKKQMSLQQQINARNFGIQNPFNHFMKMPKGDQVHYRHRQLGNGSVNSMHNMTRLDQDQPTILQQEHFMGKHSPSQSSIQSYGVKNFVAPNSHSSQNSINQQNFQHTAFSPQNYSNGGRPEFNLNQYLNQQVGHEDKYVMPQQYVTRSPNLNRIARRRSSQQAQPPQQYAMESSISSTKLASHMYDQIRDQPPPPPPRHNFPQHVIMHRARSQDRLSNRLKRQPGQAPNNQRPRSFCGNNMVNYQEYKDCHKDFIQEEFS